MSNHVQKHTKADNHKTRPTVLLAVFSSPVEARATPTFKEQHEKKKGWKLDGRHADASKGTKTDL